MSTNARIVVEIKAGMVIGVYADHDADIAVVDYDDDGPWVRGVGLNAEPAAVTIWDKAGATDNAIVDGWFDRIDAAYPNDDEDVTA